MPTQLSDRKLAANRRNAQKSTGPRTPEGKSRSSQNAFKHGLLARSILLPDDQTDESHDEFAALLADLQRQYNPQLPTERLAVQRLAVNFWRLARAYRYEADGIMVRRRKVETPLDQLNRMLNPATPPPPAPEECILPPAGMVNILLRYETAITRQIRQDMQYLEAQLQARGDTPSPVPNEPTDPNLPSSSLMTHNPSPITCSAPNEPTPPSETPNLKSETESLESAADVGQAVPAHSPGSPAAPPDDCQLITDNSSPNEPTAPDLPSSSLITQHSSLITCSAPNEPNPPMPGVPKEQHQKV